MITTPLKEVEDCITELQAIRAHLRMPAERAAAHDPADSSGYCSILDG